MGRHPFFRNNMLVISIAITVVGVALVAFSYTADYAEDNWTDAYEAVVPGGVGEDQDWNLAVRVVSPVVLVTGAWYLGEQILARRKFNRLINAEKKSEFNQNVSVLEETVRDLPHKYEDKLEEKQASFKSRR